MTKKAISNGTVHKTPADMRALLSEKPNMFAIWEDITPLARNEWICWIEDAKKSETRERRIKIMQDKFSKGDRRPCCWIGCVHRADKPMSSSQKFILGTRTKLKKEN